MATIYSKAADNDLTFVLKRSLELVKERKEQMAKKKAARTTERASVSRERRLALVLRAVMDATMDAEVAAEQEPQVKEAFTDAQAVLDQLGYGSLVGIPKRLKELNEQLTAAVAAGDGATIAHIGAEMVKVQAGKPSKSVAPSATKKSSRSNGAKSSTASTEADEGSASGASGGGE